MSLPIVIQPAADLDIERIATELHLVDPRLADDFLTCVRRTLEFLSDFPGAGITYKISDRTTPAFRRWRVDRFKNYLIFYRDEGNILRIVRVIHGARDIPTLLKKL